MKKYLLIIENTFSEILTYRFNFAMWRFRNVLQMVALYFLWQAVIPQGKVFLGYTQSLILTYIIGTQILNAMVLSSRGHEIAENIVNGDLSTFLIRPLTYFGYWFSRDIGDKAMNILFSLAETAILIYVLKPSLFIQTNILLLILFLIAIFLAILLNFIIGSLLSLVGFWTDDVWAPRFLFFMLISFFAGGIFPLDIFPKGVASFFQFLPFSYLVFFPMKVYLGQLSLVQIFNSIGVAILWIVIGSIFLRFVWKKGLKVYSAYGR